MSGTQLSTNPIPDFTGCSLVPKSVEVESSLMGATTIRCSVVTAAGSSIPITRVVPFLLEGTSATWQIDGYTRNRQDIVGVAHLESLLQPYLRHS